VKLKQTEASAAEQTADDELNDVDRDVRTSSVTTFERLQEDIVELEATQRRLRRTVNHLKDEERLLVRRRDLRPRHTGRLPYPT